MEMNKSDPPTTAQYSTARAVSDHCIAEPYYGRDQELARGWRVVIDALDQGKDPGAALEAFAVHFLANSNNGVRL